MVMPYLLNILQRIAAIGRLLIRSLWSLESGVVVLRSFSKFAAASRHMIACAWMIVGLTIGLSGQYVSAQSTYDSWVSSEFYYVGDVVAEDGRIWSAELDNIGISPSSPGQVEWTEIDVLSEGVPVFDPSQVYSSDDVVAYDSSVWRALADTVGEEPGASSVWSFIRSYAGSTASAGNDNSESTDELEMLNNTGTSFSSEWSELGIYTDPYERVVFNEMGWTINELNLSPPVGNAPLDQGCFWKLVDIPANNMPLDWVAGEIYQLGDLVSWSGIVWLSLGGSGSSAPGNSRSNWLAVAPNISVVGSWRLGERINLGDVRLHGGRYWINTSGSNSTEPGNYFTQGQSDWVAFTRPTSASPIYEISLSGEMVMPFAGLLFGLDGEFWISNQNQTTVTFPYLDGTGWLSVSSADGVYCDLLANQDSTVEIWDSATVYDVIGTTVIYGDRYYYNTASVFSLSPPPEDTANWVSVSGENQSSTNLGQGSQNWDGNTTYSQGAEVSYDGRSWVALYANNGQVPGFSGAWQPVTLEEGEEWNIHFIYDAQSVVSYTGQLWTNSYYVQGETPSISPAWVLVSESGGTEIANDLPWDPDILYDQFREYVVTHGGRSWYNTGETLNDEPGSSEVWQPVTLAAGEAWNQYFIYDVAGTLVAHNNEIWSSRYYTIGEEPGDASVWTLVSEDELVNDVWDSDVTYSASGTVVEYSGRSWYNLYFTKGDEPGASDVWQPTLIEDAEAWNTHFVYDDPFIRVSYQNEIWQNQGYTQGEEPGIADIWVSETANLDEGNDWIAGKPYPVVGTEVVYNSRIWKNLYYTQGDEPGASDVWQPVLLIPDEEWNQHFIYSTAGLRVTYLNQVWQNQGYTQGDEPGGIEGVWELAIDESDDGWYASPTYDYGAVVFHDNRYWVNQGAVAGEEPGTSTAWQPETILTNEDWNQYFVYETTGTQVFHAASNRSWFNAWPLGAGIEPNTDNAWQPWDIVSGEAWNVYFNYDTSGFIVTHLGQTWTNQWPTQGEEPGGNAGVWTIYIDPNDDNWYASVTYQYDEVVFHNNRYWVNKGAVAGEEPGTTETWQPETIIANEDWNQYFVYDTTGTQVFHAATNRSWFNAWPLGAGIEPNTDNAWQPWDIVSGEAWNVYFNYDTSGFIVTHLGQTWTNQWPTQGEEPGGNAGVWTIYIDPNDDNWYASVTYQYDEVVFHDNRYWVNKGAVAGEEPGTTETWQPETIVANEDWNQYFVYDTTGTQVFHVATNRSWFNAWPLGAGIEPNTDDGWQPWDIVSGEAWNVYFNYDTSGFVVTHLGQTWTNQWPTQGEEPGGNAGVWISQ